MLSPKMRITLMRAGAGFALVLVLVWLMHALRPVATMVMVSFLLAYILNPLVRRISARGLSRSAAAFLLLAFGFVLIAGAVLLLLPAVIEEIGRFVAAAPRYWTTIRTFVLEAAEKLNVRLPGDWDQLTVMAIERGKQYLPSVADFGARFFSSLFRSAVSFLSAVLYTLLVPVIAYYLLVSFEYIKQEGRELIPHYARQPVVDKLGEIDTVLAAFIRGQLTVASIIGVLYSVGFLVIGIDLALVLGIISGVLWVIPYVGTIFAVVVGSAIALAQHGDLLHVAYVLALAGCIQLLEGYLLTPRIVGHAIGLHPVVYILAVIVGANLFGFVGVLVAIPVTAVLKVLLKSALAAYRESYLYAEQPQSGEEP
jgi:predicted PurR-regulated permease PerM